MTADARVGALRAFAHARSSALALVLTRRLGLDVLGVAQVYLVTTKSSIATIAWPFVPTTTIVSRCLPAAFQLAWNTVDRASNERRCRFTVLTYCPST